jgi:transcriptional regulator with XRE-family HTH domain
MNLFLEALSRLKTQLRVGQDKEVAAFLGMSATAFAERKKRESFPERELLALKERRPELGLDIDYIFTGISTFDYKIPKGKSGSTSNDQDRVMGVFAALTPASQKQVLAIALRLRELEMLVKQAAKDDGGVEVEPQVPKTNIQQTAKGNGNIQIGSAGGKVSIKN